MNHWLLSCGHTAPMLEHERPDELPRRPRMCATCWCGATSEDGVGWRAELAPDDAGIDELEVPVYCPECWTREFRA